MNVQPDEIRAAKPTDDEFRHAVLLLCNEAAKKTALQGSYVQVAAWLRQQFIERE